MKKYTTTYIVVSLMLAFAIFGIARGASVFFPYQGGLGTGTVPTSGQIPIGTSGGIYSVSTLTAGSNITITNASGSITIASTASGGAANPSGSDGQLQYNNAGSFGGASMLYYDDTNDRVGIGENAPTAVLEVTTAGGSDPYFYISNAVDGDIFSVLNNGNVGIGTNSPDNPLDILGNINGLFDMEIKNTNTGTAAGARMLAHNGSSAFTFEKMSTGATYGGARKASAGVMFDSSTSGGLSLVAGGASADLRLYSGGSADANERMTILANGNVGIGTASPSRQLEITGSMELPNTTSSSVGVMYQGGNRFIHNFSEVGTSQDNLFIGKDSGNFTLSSAGGDVWLASSNIAIGSDTLQSITTGYSNSAIGGGALQKLTSGNSNVAIGRQTGFALLNGGSNVLIGRQAGISMTSGSGNTAIGRQAMFSSVSGAHGIAIGQEAGYSSIGDRNIFIGYKSGCNQTIASDRLIIDNQDRGSIANEAIESLIYGTFNATHTSQLLTFNASVGIFDSTPDAVLEITTGETGSDLFMITDTTDGDIFSVLANGNITAGGSITATGGFAGALTGNATTATALAGNGANCNAGEYALGVNASGAVESCTDATTEINSVVNALGGTNLTCASETCNVDDSFIKLGGDIASAGTYDFGSASVILEIPNAAAVTDPAVAGQIAIDTTTGQLLTHDGSAQRVFTYEKEICFALEDPVDADDNIPFYFPRRAILITDVYCQVDGGTSIVLTISDGTNALESITCDGNGAEDDGSIANGAFTALERMEFDLSSPSGTNTWLNVCVTYTITAD